jgi:hypothetical protein
MRWSQRVDKRLWVSDLVAALLHYSHSLWKFRCSFINGGTAEESDKLRLHALQKEVSKAYEDFHTDPFFVSHSLSCIFSVPLERHLKQDLDSLTNFLETVKIGHEAQLLCRSRWAASAEKFFKPRSSHSTSVVTPLQNNSFGGAPPLKRDCPSPRSNGAV